MQNPLENLVENNPQIYRARKTSCWDPGGLTVDRPVDRQRSFSDRWGSGRPARSTEPLEQRTDSLSVDLSVDRVGRPALQCTKACTSVHVGRPPDRPTSDFGRPVGRPAEAWKQSSGI